MFNSDENFMRLLSLKGGKAVSDYFDVELNFSDVDLNCVN